MKKFSIIKHGYYTLNTYIHTKLEQFLILPFLHIVKLNAVCVKDSTYTPYTWNVDARVHVQVCYDSARLRVVGAKRQ